MKGKIDKDGNMCIERDSRHDGAVYCPFQQTNFWGKDVMCGDWCPLFGEPYPHTERRKSRKRRERGEAGRREGLSTELTGKTALSLCHTTLIFDEFTDEREETNENI